MTLNSSQPHAIKLAPTDRGAKFFHFALCFALLLCAIHVCGPRGVNRGKDEISAKDGAEWRRQMSEDGGVRLWKGPRGRVGWPRGRRVNHFLSPATRRCQDGLVRYYLNNQFALFLFFFFVFIRWHTTLPVESPPSYMSHSEWKMTVEAL